MSVLRKSIDLPAPAAAAALVITSCFTWHTTALPRTMLPALPLFCSRFATSTLPTSQPPHLSNRKRGMLWTCTQLRVCLALTAHFSWPLNTLLFAASPFPVATSCGAPNKMRGMLWTCMQLRVSVAHTATLPDCLRMLLATALQGTQQEARHVQLDLHDAARHHVGSDYCNPP
jgi:hypothetical protein